MVHNYCGIIAGNVLPKSRNKYAPILVTLSMNVPAGIYTYQNN